jgi:hypothetical protein
LRVSAPVEKNISRRDRDGGFSHGLAPNPSFVGHTFRLGSNYGSLTHGTSIVVNNVKSARYLDLPYAVDMIESISQIRDRNAAPRAAQVIPGVTKMQSVSTTNYPFKYEITTPALQNS